VEKLELEKELALLRREQEISQAQNRLFETFIHQARSSSDSGPLTVTMHKAMEVMTRFSGAEKASLFLLNQKGDVTESVLARGEIRVEQRSDILDVVFDKGLAGWVKKHLTPGLITDSKTDDRWFTLPGEPYKIRSALAVPLFRHEELFGIITLMHARPYRFDEQTAGLIQQIANQLSLVIENAKLYTELERSRQTIAKAKSAIEKYSNALDAELEQGKAIQKKFLPKAIPELPHSDIAIRFHSALQLSGDFYDVFELPQEHVGILVGDVSGKGVGSALFMALARSLLRIFSGFSSSQECSNSNDAKDFSPEQALNAVKMTNDYIAREHSEDCMFVSLFFGILHRPTGKFYYVNAGHDPALIADETGVKETLMPTGPVMGPFEESQYQCGERLLTSQDTLICYTDGVTEARSPSRDFYTRDRMIRFLKKGFRLSADRLLEQMENDLLAFVDNAPQSDDITMLAMKWTR